MISFLVVAITGSLGALVRYHLGAFVHSTANRALASEAVFPFGTLFVNLVGSFILGMAAGYFSSARMPQLYYIALGAGFCGSLTTFSTLAVDLQRFLSEKRFAHFAMDLGLSVATGLGATTLGFAMARIVG